MEEPAAGAADHGTEVEKARSSCVVDMKKMLGDTDPSLEIKRWNKHSIYLVPKWIKDMNNSEAYKPSMVSLGPLHHGDPDLRPMEEHKRRALLYLVKRSGKPLQEFVAAVEEVAGQLQDAYEERPEEYFVKLTPEENFVMLMITDGCFLLELFRMHKLFAEEEKVDDGREVVDYDPNDPIFSKHGALYMWHPIRSDMLRMENQLPLLLLQKLQAVVSGTSPYDEDISNLVLYFLGLPLDGINELGLHPLDILHRSLTNGARQDNTMPEKYCNIFSAVELYEGGIHFKKDTDIVLNVHFEAKGGVLSMPAISVDDDTETKFLNLMAFERLHARAGNHVTAYVVFMDDIINTTRDVALLCSKQVIVNMLGSEEEVAKLFNTLNKGAVMSKFSVLHTVKRQMNDHCRKSWNKWWANLIHTYFRNPWMFISLVAAAILLVATLLQTVYTFVSFYRK